MGLGEHPLLFILLFTRHGGSNKANKKANKQKKGEEQKRTRSVQWNGEKAQVRLVFFFSFFFCWACACLGHWPTKNRHVLFYPLSRSLTTFPTGLGETASSIAKFPVVCLRFWFGWQPSKATQPPLATNPPKAPHNGHSHNNTTRREHHTTKTTNTNINQPTLSLPFSSLPFSFLSIKSLSRRVHQETSSKHDQLFHTFCTSLPSALLFFLCF